MGFGHHLSRIEEFAFRIESKVNLNGVRIPFTLMKGMRR